MSKNGMGSHICTETHANSEQETNSKNQRTNLDGPIIENRAKVMTTGVAEKNM